MAILFPRRVCILAAGSSRRSTSLSPFSLNKITGDPAEPSDVMVIVFADGKVNVLFVYVCIPVNVAKLVGKVFVALERSLLGKATVEALEISVSIPLNLG